MAHLSIPSLCAVSCSPAALLYLVTVWLVVTACCSQPSEPVPGENCASLSIFSLTILFFLLEMSHGRCPNKEQGWGSTSLPGYLHCPCLCTAGRLTGAHFNEGSCSVSVSRGAGALKKGRIDIVLRWRDGSHLSLIRRRAQMDSKGLWKCSQCCC